MIWRIGYIEGGGPATRRQLVAAFTRRLNDLGYQDAQYAIDPKYAEGRDDRLAALAAELLATRPDAHRLKPWPAFLDDFQRHWPTDDDIYVDFVREAHSVRRSAHGQCSLAAPDRGARRRRKIGVLFRRAGIGGEIHPCGDSVVAIHPPAARPTYPFLAVRRVRDSRLFHSHPAIELLYHLRL